MVLLYMLALSMVSLPTSLARHLLVETAGNQRGDDYEGPKPEIDPKFKDLNEEWNKGELSMIPWSFIPIFRHSRQSRQFMTLF